MSDSVHIHTQYGSVKPGNYPLVREGYDYYEIKYGGGNMSVPKAHVQGQPLMRFNLGD